MPDRAPLDLHTSSPWVSVASAPRLRQVSLQVLVHVILNCADDDDNAVARCSAPLSPGGTAQRRAPHGGRRPTGRPAAGLCTRGRRGLNTCLHAGPKGSLAAAAAAAVGGGAALICWSRTGVGPSAVDIAHREVDHPTVAPALMKSERIKRIKRIKRRMDQRRMAAAGMALKGVERC